MTQDYSELLGEATKYVLGVTIPPPELMLKTISEQSTAIRALVAENDRLRVAVAAAVTDFDDLVRESEGVYGLHMNGDPSPWSEICAGGRYEDWTSGVEKARAALGGSK